jgi:hypothetical protein
MAGFSRLGAGVACAILLTSCGNPASSLKPPQAPQSQSSLEKGFGLNDDNPTQGGAITAALNLTDLQLRMLQAFLAVKGGDEQRAYDLLDEAKQAAQEVDVDRLPKEQRTKIGNLRQFLSDHDRTTVLAALRKAAAAADVSTLVSKEKILQAMHHYFALGKAVLAKDKDETLRQLIMAQRAFADIDLDQIDEKAREHLLPMMKRVAAWAKKAGIPAP